MANSAKLKDLKNSPNGNPKYQYDAEQIQVLEGLDPVRKRPGMYVGSTGQTGLHHLVTEIVNNSMDEAIAGYADEIKVVFYKDGSAAIYDNGRGIPYAIKKGYNVTALELAFTKLHAGGKFGGGGYKVSSGLHGVGASVVNALSEWCRVIVKRSDEVVMQEYENGGAVLGPVAKLNVEKPVTKIKGAEWDLDLTNWNPESGTVVQFKPDGKIFETTNFNTNFFINQLREYAYLTAKIKFELLDKRVDQSYVFYFEGGIKSYIKALNRTKKPLHETIFYTNRETEGVNVELAFQYNDSYAENVLSFANHIQTGEGGTHLTGFRSALTRVINAYARNNGYLKEKDPNLSGEDLTEGLAAVVSVKLASENLQFEGQTKGKLGNSVARTAVETVVKDALEIYLGENPRDAQIIIGKNVLALKARMAAKAARDTVIRKSAFEGGGVLPGKLADCSEKDTEKTELFIVEGDSAGGCFAGNTKVALVDGRNLTFEEIVKEQQQGKEIFCYTIRKDGIIGVERFINARVTRKNAEVIKITLDNNEEIVCTPDHIFMTRDGTYKHARDLKTSDSLMPLYKKLSSINDPGITINEYEMVWNPKSNKWLFTHLLSDWYNLWKKVYKKPDGDHCHHIDFNKHNNNPTNLTRMPAEEHLSLHREQLSRTLHRPNVVEKVKKIFKSKEHRKKMSDRMKQPETRKLLSQNAKKQWEDQSYKEYMIEKWKEFYNSNRNYRKENLQRLYDGQKSYWGREENRQKQSKRVYQYFKENPAAKETLSAISKIQWQDKNLREWRKHKTKEQWIPEFRQKRRKALNETYYRKTIETLKSFELENGSVDLDGYKNLRVTTKDKSLLRFDTFCDRYFEGNKKSAFEAISNYNHKIVKIEKLDQKIDVYDAEVPGTHNFALASGVFVHNSAKAGRDRETQAILPIFGKTLNTERARLDKIVDSEKFKSLILAIGTGIGDTYDPKKLRYNKLIVMSDADVDGFHIQTLHLTFFYRHMHQLIEDGHVYLAVPPLYKGTFGKEKRYLFDNKELETFLKTPEGQKAVVQRFKGLGEMNADELWETTMNPETRKLKQITIEDASHADEVFSTLMGEEVAPRKRYIMTHAKDAEVDVV